MALDGEVATMYLVESDNRVYYNLKVGNFNEGEVAKTRRLGELAEGSKLIRVPAVVSREDGRYILFEHIKGLPVSREIFWKQPHLMKRVFNTLNEVDSLLNRPSLTQTEIDEGRTWISKRLSGDADGWVKPILEDEKLVAGHLIDAKFIDQVRAYAQRHQPELDDIVRIWRDPPERRPFNCSLRWPGTANWGGRYRRCHPAAALYADAFFSLVSA